MPTYSYQCRACEHAFEIVQSFSDDSLTTCPECSGQLRKVFNTIGVTFQGSGFYRNDSRAEAKKSKTSSSSDKKTPTKKAETSTTSSTTPSSTTASSATKSTPASTTS
jgi:putative FmdB family regulatory protein